jgi:hypothetical protein
MHGTIEEVSWREFQDAGLLWWVNRALHLFGWVIVLAVEDDGTIRVYPARTCWRGFSSEDEGVGFESLTAHIKANIDVLVEDVAPNHHEAPKP